MIQLFRSKSSGGGSGTVAMFNVNKESNQLEEEEEEEDEEEEEEEWEEEEEEWEELDYDENPMSTTPFISPRGHNHHHHHQQQQSRENNNHQFHPVLTVLVTALRKSLVTCSVVETSEDDVSISSIEISCPTDVRHVSHVTFDRFNGFLGLPVELQPDVPRRVPSASVSVFGVSAESMQCSFDERGNSIPMILLMMQKRLYSEGGLQAEGIFRITAENSHEEYVRKQLNMGIVPDGIDVHCLAGLIKAWLRELPTGVLDSLTPEQVMHCNTEDECTKLVKLLPPTEAALLDWAINLMVDVVQHEHQNKMNARNIAMVFAPNMTQMADPLTALIHAVQVMNFLKTLIIRTLQEREDAFATDRMSSSGTESPNRLEPLKASNTKESFDHRCAPGNPVNSSFLRSSTLDRLEFATEEKFWSIQKKSDGEEEFESVSGSSPAMAEMDSVEHQCKTGYENCEGGGILDRLSLRKGVKKLCRHPVFQLSKSFKKAGGIGFVNTRGSSREETCA